MKPGRTVYAKNENTYKGYYIQIKLNLKTKTRCEKKIKNTF